MFFGGKSQFLGDITFFGEDNIWGKSNVFCGKSLKKKWGKSQLFVGAINYVPLSTPPLAPYLPAPPMILKK